MVIRFLTFIFLICGLSFSLIAKAPKITGGDPKAKQGGMFVYEFYEPDTINPLAPSQAGSIELLSWVFESLLDSDVATDEYIPLLAKKWEISKDGRTFTFVLDERAKWYDGKPVTAEDVKFSFEVYGMPGVKNPARKVSMEEIIEKIEIKNTNEISVTVRQKLFSNFGFIASTPILPKHLYYYEDQKKMERNEYTRLPKGSGAYIVDTWQKGDRAVLKKNSNYWGKDLPQNIGAYNFDMILIRYIRDAQIAFENFKKGELDYMPIRIGNTQLWRQTKEEPSFVSGKLKAMEVISKIQQGYGFIGFNLNNELFKDKKVRMALAKAINREEIIQKSLDGMAVIPLGPLYSVDNFAGTFKAVKFDPKGALKDLENAGWKDTNGDYVLDKNGKNLEFTVLVPNARIEKEMLFIQDYWKKIGVKVHVKILEYSTWKNLQDERKFDAISNGKMRSLKARDLDPYSEWHSDNIPNGLKNFYGFKNTEVDKLIMQGREELDAKKRKKIFDRVNDIIASEYVIIQYSESKSSLHVYGSHMALPINDGKTWFPYSLGLKYWYKK